MDEWIASVEWSTVIVAVSGFIATCFASVYAGHSAIKAKQREQLTQLRMDAYTKYMQTVHRCVSYPDSRRNIRDFFNADWQARMVAGRKTRAILSDIRKQFSSLDHPSVPYKGDASTREVMELMDKLACAMLRDLKSRKR